jgi:hypothetical protein
MTNSGKAFRGSQGRGQMGYGAQKLGEFELDRVDDPQSVRQAFRGKQASGAGAYTSNDRKSVMDGDPIVAADVDTGLKSRYNLIFRENEINHGLSQPLPKPPGRSGRMTVANKGDR